MAFRFAGFVTEDDGRHRRWGVRFSVTEAHEGTAPLQDVHEFCKALRVNDFVDVEIDRYFLESGRMSSTYSMLLNLDKVRIVPR